MNKNLTIEEYLCNEDINIQNDPIEVFKLFISNNPADIQEIEKYKNKQSSLCGANVPQSSTTFQCFDCAPDPHHMYCRNCFELDNHIGHRAFYKRGVTGCCDCGDPSAIANTKSFCQLHREQQVDQQAEFNKIHPDIKQKLLQFLEHALSIYFKYAEIVQHQLTKIQDPVLLKCYAICQVIQYNQLASLLQKNLRVQNLYEDSQKMQRANKILIEFMLWLCKDRACFALVLAQFFRKKIENYQKTYFEQYIKYSLDLDIVSLDEDKSFQSLLFILNIDENFRLYTQEVFFLQQHELWRFYDVYNFDGSQIVEEFIGYFEDFTKNGRFVQKENISVKLFQSYFKKAKSRNFTSKQIWHANYFSLIYQFVSEEFQQVQFTSPLMSNLFKVNTLLQNTVNQNSVEGQNSLYTMTYFFSLKFQYNYFIKSFKNTLTEIFPEYEQKELTYEELSKLPPNKFFLESIFQSYAQVQGFQSSERKLLLVISEINMAFQYLIREAQQLEFMKQCLKKYLASSTINQYGKLNLLKLLLHFGFKNISNYKNSPSQYNYLQDLYKQNLNENEQNFGKNLKILNTFIYKSGSMIDKYFTLVLSRFLVEKNFLNSHQFGAFLEQSMLRSNQEIYVDMKMIFERCVNNFVSLLRVPQEEYIQYAYFGECKDQLVCYDIAFIKIFIILYQQQAINDLVTILQQRVYFQFMNWKNYYIEIIARVIGPDQSFYCLCAQLFSNEDLPKSMSFVLYQLLSNIFIVNHYSEFKQIKKQFQQAHFSVDNLDQYILQFCELDESVNKLQMKTLDKITQLFQLQNQPLQLYYEPQLFLNSIAIGSEIHDHLAEQKKSEYFVMFGNGIQQMIDFTQLNNYNLQLFELFSGEQNLDFFMKELEETAEPKLLFQVINRLVCVNKMINKENHQVILDKLSTIKMKLPADQNLISSILTENQQLKVEQKIETENKKSASMNSKVNKMKAKFQQKISQFSQQESVQLNELNKVDLIDDVCSVCKLKLEEDQNFCIPILIQPNPAHKFFDIFSPEIKDVIFTNELNLLKISISSCKHKFHDKCLIDLNSSQVKIKYLPNWFQISCPICKQSSETRLPINKVKGKLQVDELQSWLLLQQLNFGMKKYLQDKYGENKNQFKLFEIFLSLLIDLIFQFFADIKEFIRQEKHIIFYNILDILKGLKINANECKVILKKSDNVVITILNFIIQTACVNEQEIDLVQQIEDLKLSQQYIQQLLLCFGVKSENKIQQTQEPQELQLINSPMDRQEIKQAIKYILKQNLGLTFKDFYYRFFYQTQCTFCMYISDAATNNDQFVCMLCYQKVCDFQCKKMGSQFGNLNIHSQLFHQGISIFVSLKTGQINLLSAPITFLKYKTLYQNKFGQSIQISSMDTNWDEYSINNKVLDDVVELILNNSIKSIIKNKEWDLKDFNFNGSV